jgi:uroporphyrinogen-III synthase
LTALLREYDFAGQSVLRLRSAKAGPLLAEVLRTQGAQVDDVQLYTNEPIVYPQLPAFDAVFFASASAVEAFIAQAGVAALTDKTVVTIGKPTAAALTAHGRAPDVVAAEATVDGAIEALARAKVIGSSHQVQCS